MILSHKHKFVFIKGVKVGGTSVEIALSQLCGPDDIITPITRADERYRLGSPGEPRNYSSHRFPRWVRRRLERNYVAKVRDAGDEELPAIKSPRARFWNHIDLRRVLRLVPEARAYELLCVERSPYAKVLSLANWLANSDSYGRGRALGGSLGGVAGAVDRLIANGMIGRVVNIGRYRDLAGNVPAVPWRTEALEQEFAAFLQSRGLPDIPLVHAKQGARSDRVDPADVLRPDQIDTINRLFAEEFETFGWSRLD